VQVPEGIRHVIKYMQLKQRPASLITGCGPRFGCCTGALPADTVQCNICHKVEVTQQHRLHAPGFNQLRHQNIHDKALSLCGNIWDVAVEQLQAVAPPAEW
jgi:hypothetical protein